MTRPGGAFFVLLVCAALAGGPARAASHDKSAAAQHFKKGRVLYDQERWSDALREFEAGYEAFPLPGFLVNIGQCHRKLEALEPARDAFLRFLDARTPDEALRAEVREAVEEIEGELARRAAALSAERQKQRERAQQALLGSIAASNAGPAASNAPAPRVDLVSQPAPAPAKKKKSRWWVWTLVGTVAAGAVAAGVTVAVVESRPEAGGSLGYYDGRR
jgi:tetratricopeptide (TPR) repeat protein